MVILSSFVIATRRSESEEKCEDNIRCSEAGSGSVDAAATLIRVEIEALLSPGGMW